MRVVTGTARGRRLESPQRNDIRPTPDRIKEAVFSIIQFDIEGRKFLDLFAGSGQMGIEALSRGAATAVFTDALGSAVDIIKRNLVATGLMEKSRVARTDYQSFLSHTSDIFDITYLDPPYHEEMLEDALMRTAKVMNDCGIIICEHPHTLKICERAGDFELSKQYRYGITAISVFKKPIS